MSTIGQHVDLNPSIDLFMTSFSYTTVGRGTLTRREGDVHPQNVVPNANSRTCLTISRSPKKLLCSVFCVPPVFCIFLTPSQLFR